MKPRQSPLGVARLIALARHAVATAFLAFGAACLLGSAQSLAQNAYITNLYSSTVSVIDTTTDQVTATIPVGGGPQGVAVAPDGSKVYVTSYGPAYSPGPVSVIDTMTNRVTATITVGINPWGVAVTPDGSAVYVANRGSNTVSVINTATNTVTATIPVGTGPAGVAVTPDGSRVYVANFFATTVSVIDTATNTVTATVIVGNQPQGVAVTPDGSAVYVANFSFAVGPATVSVIAAATNTVLATIYVNPGPRGVAVTPNGSTVYVTNFGFYGGYDIESLAVIDTATNAITGIIAFDEGSGPEGVAVTPDGSAVYVAMANANSVSVIDTATNTVIDTIPVGNSPVAFGNFIQPAPGFAGMPGSADCHDQSVVVLAQQYRRLDAAAAALGYPMRGHCGMPFRRFVGDSSSPGRQKRLVAQSLGHVFVDSSSI